jgi:N-acyl-D-amino-acid deacylase
VLVGFESTYHPFIHHRSFEALAALPFEERIASLRTHEVRDAILAEGAGHAVDMLGGGLSAFVMASMGKLFPLGEPPDYEPAPETSVAAIAQREGREPLAVAYDLMLERDGHALLYVPILGYSGGGLAATREMLDHPATVLGLGDGGAHCGVLCDASLPTFMLTHWARDRTRGERLPVEKVVNLQTRRTAELYGFRDRGLLQPGMVGDVNVIDFDGLELRSPEMAYDLPAGGKRLIQRAHGYVATVKSGAVVRDHDEATGERPGVLVRGPQPDPAPA